ncbi:NADH dehydrogenase [Boeremia exigua]|uniref:NADH dehydrogenase n=1 Tax=Boeremia exigua TaxID=749465 RepID=UPI001E8DE00A|nr:NADH dehydrogenase [Boeremia exigua]KAH6643511.1 NADH dehydrogenase [Boeremia exigua]
MRRPTSCRECRIAKRKCTSNFASKHDACLECKSRTMRCSNTNTPETILSIPTNHSTSHLERLITSVGADPQLDSEYSSKIWKFVNLYFRYIHDRPHSLFHEPSIWKSLRTRSLPEQLWAAMCALGCRFSSDQNDRDSAPVFAEKSRSVLGQQLDHMTLENIQTCILLANWYAAVQKNDLEAMYFGIATRTALLTNIQERNKEDSLILQEIKLRTWWSLVIADNWCPPGLGIPRTIRADLTKLLPMDELAFQRLGTSDQARDGGRSTGIWAYQATLASTFALIQDTNYILVANKIDHLAVGQIELVAQRLLDWHGSLPDNMVMSNSNLDTYRKIGHGGTFIALHFGYHYYSTVLYFQFLNPSHQEIKEAGTYASRAKHHALAFSRLLHTARTCGDCHVVYLTVAQLTIVSSSVLLHSLLFGNDPEIEEARAQLTMNFEALEELAMYWPCVQRMKERLFVFQNQCLHESAGDAFALNRWTIRFLLEHALPFKETFADCKVA